MRHFATTALLALSILALSEQAQAMKWRDYRQSDNVIDIRAETKAVNTQMDLESGRRYLVAMMAMVEKDATEHPECIALSLEIEKIKTVKGELEGLGNEPVRRLTCDEENISNRVNLCAKIRAKDPANPPPMPDLKEFEEELAEKYGPAIDQVSRLQASLEGKSAMMQREDIMCRATLQLVERKAVEVKEKYTSLLQMIRELRQRQ